MPDPAALARLDPEQLKQVAEMIGKMKDAFDRLMAPIRDFASQIERMAGSSGLTAMLRFQFEQLGRGVGAVVLPTLSALTDTVRRLSDWFHSLTERQQDAIQGLIVGAAAAKAMSVAMAALGVEASIATAGISAVVGALAAIASGAGDGPGKLGAMFSGLMERLKPILDTLGDTFTDLLSDAKPAIEAIYGLLEMLAGVFAEVLEQAKPLVRLMIQAFAWSVQQVTDDVSAFGDAIFAVAEVCRVLGKVWDNYLSPAIAGLRAALPALVGDHYGSEG